MTVYSNKFDNQEKKARLRLIRSENIGPITFNQLLQRFKNAKDALEAIPKLAEKGGTKHKLKIFPEKDALREAENLRNLGGQFLHKGEEDYPLLLAITDDAPPVLSLLGNRQLLTKQSFAMVGARNASTNAKRLAQQFAKSLSQQNMLITSGLARGIDAFAHQGAIDSGTLAVVAGGVDIIYPKENTKLYHEIKERGALISEMPLGMKPQARHFPRRNRIISGISWGVLVVEAALKSGSLITARYATDQNRDVFAVPGHPFDARSKGTNDLIRNGAYMCESINDILNVYATHSSFYLSDKADEATPNILSEDIAENEISTNHREKVIEAVGHTSTTMDDLLHDTLLPLPVIWTILMELELAGRLERLAGGRIALLIAP